MLDTTQHSWRWWGSETAQDRQITERGCGAWETELEPGKGSTVASFIPMRDIMDTPSAPQPGSPRQHLKLWTLAGIQIHSCLVLKPSLFLVHRRPSEGTSALGLGETVQGPPEEINCLQSSVKEQTKMRNPASSPQTGYHSELEEYTKRCWKHGCSDKSHLTKHQL